MVGASSWPASVSGGRRGSRINNPLASIALNGVAGKPRGRAARPGNPDHTVIANYLEMIQARRSAARITEKLLDFSYRAGQTAAPIWPS